MPPHASAGEKGVEQNVRDKYTNPPLACCQGFKTVKNEFAAASFKERKRTHKHI
jgi:hypothetical protein